MTVTVGIDSGSTATKGILLDDGVIQRRFLCPTPFRPADAIVEAWETLRAGLSEPPFLTLTGYGRQLVDFADKQVTEISCHGLGARLLAPQTRTVIDIGGQDSKVIQLDEAGNLTDFLMNDKCAAGTGRFLEVISRTLGRRVASPVDVQRATSYPLPGFFHQSAPAHDRHVRQKRREAEQKSEQERYKVATQHIPEDVEDEPVYTAIEHYGAGKMVLESGNHPAVLRDQVTSHGNAAGLEANSLIF